ncbi:SDR family oxidoreductase [Billgrantia gudaonensis]|uniref:SDR family oxidoreductase n=1 Tax=Billgrantia gudaonensis TaxID=376427 RepID=A0A3S0R4I6_9GAMM|nr:SDR family oxidoreductase [Halomonas gudaonensis]
MRRRRRRADAHPVAGPELRSLRVNAISPGLIDTRMMESLDAAKRQAMIGTTPLQRLGRPDEIASVVDFLCSDAASFMTGESLQVNGGLYQLTRRRASAEERRLLSQWTP